MIIVKRHNRSIMITIGILLVSVLVVITVLLTVQVLKPKPPIPKSITSQANFIILVPISPAIVIDSKSAGYNSSLKLIDYNVTMQGVKTVVSEQPAPSVFTDVPATYEKTLASMNQYSQFDSLEGAVYLTKPQQLAGKQAAVLLSKGTLMFVKPSSDLTDDQWRQFFNSLVVNQ